MMKREMRHYLGLALRELLAQKIIAALLLIAVVLSTMLTTAVGQSAGVLAAMREQQAITIGGNRYASFVQLNEAQLTALQQDERLSYVGVSVAVGSMSLTDLLKLNLTEYWDGTAAISRPAYSRLQTGRLPEAPFEIALSAETLQFLGYTGEIGDKITLPLAKAVRHGIMVDDYEYTAEFTLTGILQNNYLGYSLGWLFGLVGEGTAAAVLPSEYYYYNADIRTYDKAGFQSIMDDLCAQLEIHELDTLYNIPYLKALGIYFNTENSGSRLAGDGPDDAGFSYLLAVGVLLVGLILLAAGLVIYNILKIAVAQRVRQYGVLRAIGAGKGQLYAVVTAEVVLLCLLGIPLGMLFGALSAQGILSAALSQLSPEVFMAQDLAQLQELIAANSAGKWGYLLLSAAVTAGFAFLAAAPAARFAANVPPVMAMSGQVSRIKRHRRSRRQAVGRHFERSYARLNLSRNRGRTAITIMSLVMSITVFIALQSFLSLLSVAGAESEHLGDYSIINQVTGISSTELAELAAVEDVQGIAAQQFAIYEMDENGWPKGIASDLQQTPGETLQIFGWNEQWLDWRLRNQLTDEQLAAWREGRGCVVRNPIPLEIEGRQLFNTRVEAGSTINIAGHELLVLLAFSDYDAYFSVGNDGFTNGVQILVNEQLFPQLTGSSAYAELRPILQPEADRESFGLLLEQLCQRLPGTTALSFEQADQQLAESEAQIRLLAWGLILFIGLIGVLNIINTVYTNIQTRRAEIGMQRAIGMSNGSLYATFLWEGAYYGLIASLLGGLCGWGCTVLVQAATTDTLGLAPVPWLAFGEAAGVSILACMIATAIPLRSVSRLSIVEAIEAVE